MYFVLYIFSLRPTDIMRVRVHKKTSFCFVFFIVMLIFLLLQVNEEHEIFTAQ